MIGVICPAVFYPSEGGEGYAPDFRLLTAAFQKRVSFVEILTVLPGEVSIYLFPPEGALTGFQLAWIEEAARQAIQAGYSVVYRGFPDSWEDEFPAPEKTSG